MSLCGAHQIEETSEDVFLLIVQISYLHAPKGRGVNKHFGLPCQTCRTSQGLVV